MDTRNSKSKLDEALSRRNGKRLRKKTSSFQIGKKPGAAAAGRHKAPRDTNACETSPGLPTNSGISTPVDTTERKSVGTGSKDSQAIKTKNIRESLASRRESLLAVMKASETKQTTRSKQLRKTAIGDRVIVQPDESNQFIGLKIDANYIEKTSLILLDTESEPLWIPDTDIRIDRSGGK